MLWSGPVCKVSEEDIFSKYTGRRDDRNAPPFDEALKSRTEKYIWPDFLGRDTDVGEDLEKLSIPGSGYSATTTRAFRWICRSSRLQDCEEPAIVRLRAVLGSRA